MQKQKLTEEERERIMDEMGDYALNGETEKAMELLKLIPLPAYLAKSIKEVCGVDYLISRGLDLSEAEEEYGKDWLNN